MRTVDTLGDAEQGSVWRCPACTVSWIDGVWCRLDYHQWIELPEIPSGPFYEIEGADFSDYRDSLLRYH